LRKQFLKQINREVQQKFLQGSNESFFKEWDDEVSNIWIKRIESAQQALNNMKKVKFTLQDKEIDFNEYSNQKYTQILRDCDDTESEESDESQIQGTYPN